MVTTPVDGATIEDVVVEILREANLLQWQQSIVFGRQIRRIEHFGIHSDKEFKDIGMTQEEVRRLRQAVGEMQKTMRSRHLEPQMVYIRNETTSPIIDPNKTVITKEQIKLMEAIGEGTFAVVKRALWYQPDGKKIDVAVKILRDVSPVVMEDLQVEAGHLLKLQHPHLIRLYGVVTQPAMMVFELCEGGALLDRLRDSNKPVPLLNTLLDYCLQIVKAMAYLEAKHCVHRDLAARNILLTKDEKIVKICDFGLMRNLKENEQMYIMGPQKRVPFSWCPPESLKHRKFSHASDVWAFGVTVWEVFTLGEEPWIGCRAIEVLKRLDAGERLEKPASCSQQIYDIIGLCWKVNPDHRPRFTQLKGFLQQAQFNIAEVREVYSDSSDSSLQLSVGDKVVVIENTGVTWYGQNERTRKFGSFLRSSVFVHGKTAMVAPLTSPAGPSAASIVVPSRPAPPIVQAPAPQPVLTRDLVGNSKISAPIRGSFIHTGHADIRGGHSWGQPENIDEIYIKNPVRGVPLEPGIPLIVPSMTEGRPTSSTSRAAPPPPKHEHAKPPSSISVRAGHDPLHPDWGDFDRAQTPSFSPSRIELPSMAGFNVTPPSNVPSRTTSNAAASQQYNARDVWSSSAVQQRRTEQTSSSQMHKSSNIIIPTNTGTASVLLPTQSRAPSTRPNVPSAQSQLMQQPQPGPSSQAAANRAQQNVLGNGVSRAPVAVQSVPRPSVASETRRSENRTPPTINSNNFAQQPRANPTGVDPKVMDELNKRLNLSGTSVRLRSTTHSTQPVVTVNATGLTLLQSAAPDPFVIHPNVKEVVEKERYNQIVEKKAGMTANSSMSQLAPSSSGQAARPHSTMGIPLSSMPSQQPLPCLVPTQLPLPTKSANHNNTYRAAVTQNPVAPQNPVAAPPHRSTAPTTTAQPPTAKLTVSIPPLPSTAPPPLSTRGSSVIASSLTPPTASSVVPRAVPASTAAVVSDAPTPAGTLPRNESDRRSRIDDEISSMLPAPSSLFYGTAGSQPAERGVLPRASSTSTLLRPASVAYVSAPAVKASVPVPVAPQPVVPPAVVDPLPISLNSVLQPTRLPSSLASSAAAAIAVPAPSPARTVDISSIMNAYNAYPVVPYTNPLNPQQHMLQGPMPLFALNNAQRGVYPIGCGPTSMYGGGGVGYGLAGSYGMGGGVQTVAMPQSTTRFSVGEHEDIVEALDPMRSTPMTSTPLASDMRIRATQMEILYKEANFCDPSRCDEMVNKCDGDIQAALRELKMDYLVDTCIAKDKGRAWSALETHEWDLNRAAEQLLG